MTRALPVVLVACLAASAHADTLHVPADYGTIQNAIVNASSGDVIQIAAGTYSVAGVNLQGKQLTIRGAGKDETSIGRIQINNDPLFIVNTLVGRTVFEDLSIGAGNTTVGGAAHVLAGVEATFRRCEFASNRADRGGAIALETGARVLVDDCLIASGVADEGGAIWCAPGSELTVNLSQFVLNYANDAGGAIYARNADVTIEFSAFIDNNIFDPATTRGQGGAIYLEDCDSTVFDTTITECSSFDDGAGMYIDGGIHDIGLSEFTENDADGAGGAIAAVGDAIVEIQNTEFFTNTASDGGAISVDGAILRLKRSWLDDNHASNDGGAVSVAGFAGHGSALLGACVIENNTADNGGGVALRSGVFDAGLDMVNVQVSDNHASGATACGGVLSAESVSPGDQNDLSINFCTIANNTGSVFGNGVVGGGQIDIASTIVWGNQGADTNLQGSPAVRACILAQAGLYPGQGNINQDPLLRDISFAQVFPTVPYVIVLAPAAGSPALDAGLAPLPFDALDLDEDGTVFETLGDDIRLWFRVWNDPVAGGGATPVDIGAVELNRCTAADFAYPFGLLNFSDVLAFLTAFAEGEPGADLAPPPGVFDFSDVLAFLASFGAGCP